MALQGGTSKMSFGFDIGNIAGSLLGIGGSLLSNAMNASNARSMMEQQYGYNRDLMTYQNELNKDYSTWNYKNQPSYYRQGLEKAGFNPILAANAGQLQGGTSGLGSVGSQSIAPIDFVNSLSQIKATNANASLMKEQAETEKSKRENYWFQNMMLDVEKHLKDKELAWFDKKAYQEIYKDMQQAEFFKAEASVAQYNANTARMVADAQKLASQASWLNSKGTYYYNTTRSKGFSESSSYSGNAGLNLRKGLNIGGSYSSSKSW